MCEDEEYERSEFKPKRYPEGGFKVGKWFMYPCGHCGVVLASRRLKDLWQYIWVHKMAETPSKWEYGIRRYKPKQFERS